MKNLSYPQPIVAIDVDLAGDILRVVTSGLPALVSRNATDALNELQSEHELLRDFLNLPPNGNHLINSCLLYPPFEQGADGALFLASRFAYAPYAGTALMAAATVLAQAQDNTDRRLFEFETAQGAMGVELIRNNNIVTRAKWFVETPKLLINDGKLQREAGGTAAVSIVDAGLPYLVVDSDKLGIELSDHSKLSTTAIELSAVAGNQFPMAQSDMVDNYSQYLVMFTSKVVDNHIKTVWVSDKGEVANSAGGTGALAVFIACKENGSLKPESQALIEAPGGTFTCGISGNQASVTANIRIVAKHTFNPAPR